MAERYEIYSSALVFSYYNQSNENKPQTFKQ